jgi:HSP20 family molecular chaperone IbpA
LANEMADSLDEFFKLVKFVLSAVESGEPVTEIRGKISSGKSLGIEYGFSVRSLEEITKRSGAPFGLPSEKAEPPIEVIDRKRAVVIIAHVPEVRGEDVSVDIAENSISVVVKSGSLVHRWEIPSHLKTKLVSATCNNGVLEIILKKGRKRAPKS